MESPANIYRKEVALPLGADPKDEAQISQYGRFAPDCHPRIIAPKDPWVSERQQPLGLVSLHSS
jgi:hypothetical protein